MGRSKRISLSVAARWLLVVLSSAGVTWGDSIRRKCTREGHSGLLACSSWETSHLQHQGGKPSIKSASNSSRRRSSATVTSKTGAMAWVQPSGTLPSLPSGSQERRAPRAGLFRPDLRLWLPCRRHDLPIPATIMGRVSSRGGAWGHNGSPTKTMAMLYGDGNCGFSRNYGRVSGASPVKTTGLLVSSAATSAPAGAGAAAPAVEISKPDLDERLYRYLTLPNGLGVMLVSDLRTESAAASMFIRAGHMQDPDELAGMAHFHEHSESSKRHPGTSTYEYRTPLICAVFTVLHLQEKNYSSVVFRLYWYVV